MSEELQISTEEEQTTEVVESTEQVETTEQEATEQTADELIGGKFKSQEDLLSAYQELEKKLGSSDEEEASEEQIEEAVASLSTEDLTAFDTEFKESGELSDETFTKLEEKGIPRPYVESYIQGLEAIQQQQTQMFYDSVGGEEAYTSMTQWAKTGLSTEEQTTFNNLVESGDAETLKLAVAGLQAKYQKAVGSSTDFQKGDTTTSGIGFSSMSEIVAAKSDPRYSRDAKYRDEVTAKIAASKF